MGSNEQEASKSIDESSLENLKKIQKKEKHKKKVEETKRLKEKVKQCKKHIEDSWVIIKIFDKLEDDEKKIFVEYLSTRGIHVLEDIIHNTCIEQSGWVSDSDIELFEKKIADSGYSEKEAKNFYSFMADVSIPFDKKKKKIFSQNGKGVGLLALIPLLLQAAVEQFSK